jgi:hypothetical protein
MGGVMWLWIIAAVCTIITIYAVIRKGIASLPLVLGLWFLFASGLLLSHWFPPTPTQIAICFLLFGLSLTLLVWGIYNLYANITGRKLKSIKKDYVGPSGEKYFIALQAEGPKPVYGIIYGLIPWNDYGADLLFRFLNEEIWWKGYAVKFFDAEYAEISGIPCAFILGIITRKTIIDRILY